MTRRRTIQFVVLLALAAAWYALLPRAAVTLPGAAAVAPVRGAVHVHTRRSDGTGTLDEVAAAAARAGLAFIVVTDHGDATRMPEAPVYLHGVLCIDAVEISTEGGHVVALGLPPAPYPLAGAPGDVIDDIARLGGFAVIAHPGSAKPELQWLDWEAPFGGLEWLNADSEWRDESRLSLLRVLLSYPFRGRESLASMLDRPDAVLAHWDELTGRRRVVGLAAVDAHARIGLRNLGERYDSSAQLRIPSYETLFRTFSIAVPAIALTGDAAADAAAVEAAIRGGRFYSAIDALAGPGGVRFTARSGRVTAGEGDLLPLDGPVTLRVETVAPPDALIAILKNGSAFRIGDGSPIEEVMPPEPAVYRVEVRLPGAPGTPPVPWLLSNPIYVGRTDAVAVRDTHAPAAAFTPTVIGAGRQAPKVEASAQASGAVDVVAAQASSQLVLRYALGGRQSEGPYVAFALPSGPELAGHDRLVFTARANRTMRMGVQLRVPGGPEGERWQQSVVLDDTPREIVVYIDEMTPRGATSQPRPVLASVDSILFVVDGVNTPVGSNGQIRIENLRYGR